MRVSFCSGREKQKARRFLELKNVVQRIIRIMTELEMLRRTRAS
jgi:hypothetical protein